MTTPVAFGWGVKLAVTSEIPSGSGGRLAVAGGNYCFFNNGAYPGYDGFTVGGTEFRVDSDAASDALIRWLARKPTGPCSVLVCDGDETSYEFGDEFQAGLTRNGHTFTVTGDVAAFGGYDPLDFDVLCAPGELSAMTYHGLVYSNEVFDYILSHGGAVLACPNFLSDLWERYGIVLNAWHNNHPLESSPYQRPFYCAPIGELLYKLVRYTTLYLTVGTNLKGGTLNVYGCEYDGCGQGVVALWDGPSA